LHHRDDLSISEPTDTVLISDSGCDQSIIKNKAFYIFFSGQENMFMLMVLLLIG